MKHQEPEQTTLNVDLSAAEDITCVSCGNYTFEQVVLMKRLSALISPTGKEAMVPIPVFACNACGNINPEFLPAQLRKDLANKTQDIKESTLTGGAPAKYPHLVK